MKSPHALLQPVSPKAMPVDSLLPTSPAPTHAHTDHWGQHLIVVDDFITRRWLSILMLFL